MTTKTLEIRDRHTFIPALAIRMVANNPTQAWYMHYRCGHPEDGASIVLMRLSDMRATNDPYQWPSIAGDTRTMPVAHEYVLANFDALKDGSVVDVQFILGETDAPETSERLQTIPAAAALPLPPDV